MAKLGVIAIGRNEGQRLVRCLRALVGEGRTVVYVDSGSTDASTDNARELGVEVVRLDLSTPFTAARARNAGFERLTRIEPDVEFVQFIDGDCEVVPGWIDRALGELHHRPEVAIVCGRLRERAPEASIYNRLCDLEWNRQPGEVERCGGIFLIRAAVFRNAGGFNADLIAGEEPELCWRLRKEDWKIWRLPDDMALHDAAMLRFGQWWKRAVRSGYAYAQEMSIRARDAGLRHRSSTSIWFWSLLLPIAAVGLALPTRGLSLLLLALYPLQIARTARRFAPSMGGYAWLHAAFLMLAKFAQLQGQLRFWADQWRRRRPQIIEYK